MERIRMRKLVMARVAFRRRLIKSLVLALTTTLAVYLIIIVYDHSREEREDGKRRPQADAAIATESMRNHSLSSCRAWMPVGANPAVFDPVRSCAVEAALARAARLPLCVLADHFQHVNVATFKWFRRLKAAAAPIPGSLMAFSPTYEEVFDGTVLKELVNPTRVLHFLKNLLMCAVTTYCCI